MRNTRAGFVDAGYLRAQGAEATGRKSGQVRPDASAVVNWLQSCVSGRLHDRTLLRTYWYDGVFDASHVRYPGQRKFFDAIAFTPGVQLRLGHIAEHPVRLDRHLRQAIERTAKKPAVDPTTLLEEFTKAWAGRVQRQQKGVDALMVLDLVRLAGRTVFSTMILITGDRDLAEAVRAAQDFGTRVIIATPRRDSFAREVIQLADDIIDIPDQAIRSMLPLRPRSE